MLSTYDLDEVWKEILNGEYHAIVVVDLPANGNEPENEVPGPLGVSFACLLSLAVLLPSAGRRAIDTLSI